MGGQARRAVQASSLGGATKWHYTKLKQRDVSGKSREFKNAALEERGWWGGGVVVG